MPMWHRNQILAALKDIQETLTNMATQANLDAAVAAIRAQAFKNQTANQAALTLMIDDAKELLAAIAKGQDFTSEVQTLTNTTNALEAAAAANTAAAQAEDQIVNPPGPSDMLAPNTKAPVPAISVTPGGGDRKANVSQSPTPPNAVIQSTNTGTGNTSVSGTPAGGANTSNPSATQK